MSAFAVERTVLAEFEPAPLDPLEEASTWLRRAVTVPYEASDPGRWLKEFQVCVANARRMLGARAAYLREESYPMPRLRQALSREAEAHEQVARMADALFTDAYLAVEPDLLDMVDLTEAVKALERAVSRRRNHRSDLFFEATHRDIGGGG